MERDPDLFAAPLPPRREFLEHWFQKSFSEPLNARTKLTFKPSQKDENIISGAVARWHSKTIESDPDDPFKPVEGGEWERSSFFLNVGNDQQVIGIERNDKVAQPTAIVNWITESINRSSSPGGYKIDGHSLNTKNEFWKAVQEYPGKVTTLKYDLVVPNPVDTSSPTRKAMQELREKMNAREVKETYSNPDGLNLDNDLVRDRTDYAESGSGEVVAKDGNHAIFDSKQNVRTVEVNDELRPTGERIDGLSNSLSEKLRK